ncbi:MAG: transposase [Oscillospiraceae bacterium]|nr:transposase [Oscillospiraceae bacterium]
MAIISCPECGGSVSSLAAACPHCGYGVAEHIAREKERENLHPEIKRLLDKVIPCEFTVPPPRAKVCIKCCSDQAKGFCEHDGVKYPLVEVDFPEYFPRSDFGVRLYMQKHCVAPRNIGDTDSVEYQEQMDMLDDLSSKLRSYPHPPDPSWFGKSKTQVKAETKAAYKAMLQSKPNTPKCPACGSTNISKISTATRAAHGFAFGLFSSTARSQFKCNACGYKW